MGHIFRGIQIAYRRARATHRSEKAIKWRHRPIIDPSTEKRRIKALRISESENSLKSVAFQWLDIMKPTWTEKHYKRTLSSLEHDIFKPLGFRPVNEITSPEILQAIKKIEKRAPDQAKRTLQRVQAIFTYAIAAGMLELNPAQGLFKALKGTKKQKQSALTEKQLPEFMQKLEFIEYNPIIKIGLEFLIHTMTRTSEVRLAKWSEIDLNKNQWIIAGERMKMDRDHIVPLNNKTLSLLERVKFYCGDQDYIFCGARVNRPINQNAFLNLIKALGYGGRLVTHGFRSTASTILNETGFNPDWIERQLAHAEKNKVRASLQQKRIFSRQGQNAKLVE